MTSRAGNQYVMIAYHSSDPISVQPFTARKDKHRIEAYNTIMTRLKAVGLDVDLQVLDNEACSKDYKEAMINKWKMKYQLFHQTCTGEMLQRGQEGHLRPILFQCWLEWMMTSLATFGTCWYPKQR